MRTIVFFDLPTETLEDKRNYRKFRKTLIRNGFLMIQESVYARMLITPSAEQAVLNLLRKNRPPAGVVQVLTVTEKQFAKMEFLTGSYHSDVIDSTERLVILYNSPTLQLKELSLQMIRPFPRLSSKIGICFLN